MHYQLSTKSLNRVDPGWLPAELTLQKFTVVNLSAVFFSLLPLVSCQNNSVESQELKATILRYEASAYRCSQGYIIQPEMDGLYVAKSAGLPAPYDDPDKLAYPVTIWLRYEPSLVSSNWCGRYLPIKVVSMRAR